MAGSGVLGDRAARRQALIVWVRMKRYERRHSSPPTAETLPLGRTGATRGRRPL